MKGSQVFLQKLKIKQKVSDRVGFRDLPKM